MATELFSTEELASWRAALLAHGYTLVSLNELTENVPMEVVKDRATRLISGATNKPKLVLLSDDDTHCIFSNQGRITFLRPRNITPENLYRSLASILSAGDPEPCAVCLTNDDLVRKMCPKCRNYYACLTCFVRMSLQACRSPLGEGQVACTLCRHIVLDLTNDTIPNFDITDAIVERYRADLLNEATEGSKHMRQWVQNMLERA